jgi:hypothetical protein
MKLALFLSLVSLSSIFGAGDSETPADQGSSYQPNKTPEQLGTDSCSATSTGAVRYDLDAYIPVPVQKKYGIYGLSPDQKSQLAGWLQAVSKQAPSMEPSMLSLNIASGQFIQLDDGTVWEINPKDQDTTQGWLSPVKIVVSRSQNQTFPYRLYNTATGSAVTARRVSMNAIQN